MTSLLSPSPKTPHQRSQDVRSSSPSYFGLAVEPGKSTVHSSGMRGVKVAFSPPSTSIRSVAATSPQGFPVHANPEYEAFRRRSEQTSFSLSQGGVSQFGITRHNSRPSVSRTSSKQSPPSPQMKTVTTALQKAESTSGEEAARLARSPKRLLSSESQALFERPRRESPASFLDNGLSISHGSPPTKQEEKFPRLSLPPKDEEEPPFIPPHRAETLPEKFENTNPKLTTPQHIINILDAHEEEILVLDLRVSTQYSRAHITGALNLCVPTTLLKRSSYNVQRLADTFKDDTQRLKFEQWENCRCIVVYDVNSTQMKEATNCTNILKKFYSEGWDGEAYIIRGGFVDFSRKFPSRVEQGNGLGASVSPVSPTLKGDGLSIAPVIGGCPIPATKNAANPFFGNIRQNMDLIGGVGQMSIKHPASMKNEEDYEIPAWLLKASDESDNGKTVSDKFLYIEKREQKRMQEALSGNVVYGTPGPDAAKQVQIAGIEKGAKNRYNNIWPYEHSRVKLEDVPANGCDYVNANFVQTSLSNKRYIATQGPIPATFVDFWNMVWQRDTRVIVMLTAETEGGQIKAHNYWSDRHYGSLKLKFLSEHRASLELSKIQRHRKRPSLGGRRSTTGPKLSSRRNSSSQDADKLEMTMTAASDQPYVIVRRFTLSNDSQPFERMREITQLQYSSWPDFGAPAHPAHLLGLVEQCHAVVSSSRNNSFRGIQSGKDEDRDAEQEERPVLVHCSAGCGRTGTFCTVDSVVDMLKKQRRARMRRRSGQVRDPTPMEDEDASGDFGGNGRNHMEEDGHNPFFNQGGFHFEAAAPSPTRDDRGWLERDDVDLVEKTVEEFRLQRLSMVQSLRQFVLCYETVLEWVVAQQEGEKEEE